MVKQIVKKNPQPIVFFEIGGPKISKKNKTPEVANTSELLPWLDLGLAIRIKEASLVFIPTPWFTRISYKLITRETYGLARLYNAGAAQK